MKKLTCTFVLAVAFSSPAVASKHEATMAALKVEMCKVMGGSAQNYLSYSKNGTNPHDRELTEFVNYGIPTNFVSLAIAQDVWENRRTYNNAKAYAAGYRICMVLY